MNDFGGKTIEPASPPTQEEKTYALVAHLSQFTSFIGIPGFIGPLVIWLIQKDKSPFVGRHALEALLFQVGLFVVGIVFAILSIITCGIGTILFIPLLIAFILYVVIATMRANEGKIYSYPVTGGFIK
jgi:uncharacterized Tic20 family protein